VSLITFLVEDNPTIRDNLIPAMEDLANASIVGYAETEGEAVRWLRTHAGEWHLAVVDLFLKEGSGLGVLANCRERGEHQRVVVLTNYATADIRERCLKLGANAVFDKSNELDAFLDYCNRDRPSSFAALQ
jgi:ActR/RegA family two-component response regulator